MHNIQNKQSTTLYDFAKNKRNLTKTQQKPFPKPVTQKSLSSFKSIGLDTLLHFQDSQNISSVLANSRGSIKGTNMNQSSRYKQVMLEAKDQIQELKAKRIQLQNQWKAKQPQSFYQKQQQEQSVLDVSEVEGYNFIAKLKNIQNKSMLQQRDGFRIQLKRDILFQRLKDFTQKIDKLLIFWLFKQLQLYQKIVIFRKDRQKIILRATFRQWLQVSEQLSQRRKIKETIINKIKNRNISKQQQKLKQKQNQYDEYY